MAFLILNPKVNSTRSVDLDDGKLQQTRKSRPSKRLTYDAGDSNSGFCPHVRKQKHAYRCAEVRCVAAGSVTVDAAKTSVVHGPVDILKCRPVSFAFDLKRIKMQPADAEGCNEFRIAVAVTGKNNMSVACLF